GRNPPNTDGRMIGAFAMRRQAEGPRRMAEAEMDVTEEIFRDRRRTMTTILKLTPKDHGRRVTPEEWETAEADDKLWKYEVIDGVIHVSPPPDMDHDGIADWLHLVFAAYRLAHPD